MIPSNQIRHFDKYDNILKLQFESIMVFSAVAYQAALSLRAGGRGFPPAIMNVAPGYFHR